MKKLLSLAMLSALLFAAGCDDDDKCPSSCKNGCESDGKTCKVVNTCPTTCTNGCEADGKTCKAANTCPTSCTNGCEADGKTCKAVNTCPTSCTNGCEADGKTCKAANTCPSTCTNGCEADGTTCKAANTCPSSCTNGCEADGTTCKPANTCPTSCTNGCEADGTTCKAGDNDLDAGIDPVPEGQPTSGACDPETFVEHCNGNKQVSCYGTSSGTGYSVHEDACDSEHLCVTLKEDQNRAYCILKCDANVGDTRKACTNDDDGRDVLHTQECRNSKNGKVWNVKEVQICSTVCTLASGPSGEDSCGAEEACTDTEVVTCDENEVAYHCEEFEGKTVKTVLQCGIFNEVCYENYGCDEEED